MTVLWTPEYLGSTYKNAGSWIKFSDASSLTLSGSEITNAASKFGNGKDFFSVSASAPDLVAAVINGKAVARFASASSHYLTNNTLSNGTTKPTKWTAFVVGKIDNNTTNSCLIGSMNGTGTAGSGWGTVFVQASFGTKRHTFWYGNSGAIYRWGYSTNQVIDGTFNIHSDQRGATQNNILRANGSAPLAISGEAGTATESTGEDSNYSMGRFGAYNGYYLTGDIAEVIVIPIELPDEERQKIEGYLAWEYDLVSKLPVGHPYKDAAPTWGTDVPDSSGNTQAEYEIELTAAGLILGTVTTAYSETVPVDVIISQDPAAGTAVAVGSAVDIVVSKGPESFGCPDIINKEETTAQSILTAAGLISGTVGSVYSFIIPIGYVVSQYPLPETSVMPGDDVDYNLSLGGSPVSYIPMSLVVPQFFDANGVPLASGVITAYVAGGTSAAYFYSDSTGAGATQSITLNSRGEPETGGQTYIPFLDNTVSYKVKLKNAAGTEIYTTPDSGFTPYDNTGVPVDSSISTAKIQDDAVTFAKIQNIATARLLGRATAGTGAVEALTLTQVLDLGGTAAQGNLLYRGASAWGLLAPGTAGDSLISGGAAANPAWSSINTIYANETNQSIGTGVGWQKLPGGLTVKWGRFTSDNDNAIAVTFGTDQGGAFATICVGVTISPYTGTATNMWSPALIATTGFTSKRDGSVDGSIECQYMAIGY